MQTCDQWAFIYANRPHQDGWPMRETRLHILGALLPLEMHRAVVNRWLENVAQRAAQDERRA
jgi:hypothetical protein